MTENKGSTEIVEVAQDLDRAGWGDRNEITTMGKRLSAMLPGVKTEREAQRLAQASILSRANPFRGEMYVFGDQIIEGYKLLVRWAKRQEDYTADYTKLAQDDPQMEQVKAAEIGYTCEIWRDSVRSGLVEACKAGIPYETARKMFLPESAVGIVSHGDTFNTTRGYAIDPPKGWSWEQVAKKRALKNALNIAYGMPSPDELAKESWEVDGQATRPEDWRGVEELNQGDAAALAKDRAHWREHNAQIEADPAYAKEHREKVEVGADALFPNAHETPVVIEGKVVEMPVTAIDDIMEEVYDELCDEVDELAVAVFGPEPPTLDQAAAFTTPAGTAFGDLDYGQLIVVIEAYSKMKATEGWLTDDQAQELKGAQLLRDDLKAMTELPDDQIPF